MRKHFIYVAITAVFSSGVNAQEYKAFAEKISPQSIRKHLEVLASDDFAGRETAMPGQKKAAAYIENHFAAIGLDTVFQQHFDVWASGVDGTLSFKGQKHEFLNHFYFYQAPYDTVMSPKIVWGGNGRKPEIERLELNGKALLVSDADMGSFKSAGLDWRQRTKLAQKAGASCVLVITPNFNDKVNVVKYYLSFSTMKLVDKNKKDKKTISKEIPTVFISEEFAESLLTSSGVQLKKLGKLKLGEELSEKVELTIDGAEKKMTTSNVLGVLWGTDKRAEVLILTAHYDHLGKKGALTFYGADDDGSGTSALMEIAEVFSGATNSGQRPKRTILFMAVSGEEKGLLGSQYYVENPLFSLENTVANLNIDMIGRIDKEHAPDSNYVYIIGSDKLSSELHALSEGVNASYTQLILDYTYNDEKDPNQFYYRSDHYNFAKNKIPVIFYFTGVHEDYHQATDTADKIMYGKTAHVAKLVFATAWELINAEKRPTVDSNKK